MKNIYKIYCDESGIDSTSNYYFMSSIWIPKDKGYEFVNAYWDRIEAAGYVKRPEHLKWTNVPNKSTGFFMPLYTMLVDLFFECEYINFRMIAAPKYCYDISSKIYNEGDYENGFYKLYYQMIVHKLNPSCLYHVRLADREVSMKVHQLSKVYRNEQLKLCLNRKMKSQYNVENVLTVEPRPAKNRLLIQIGDILMGAVAYHYNKENEKENAKEGKVFLSRYIASKLGYSSLFVRTPKEAAKFNIFYLTPK